MHILVTIAHHAKGVFVVLSFQLKTKFLAKNSYVRIYITMELLFNITWLCVRICVHYFFLHNHSDESCRDVKVEVVK